METPCPYAEVDSFGKLHIYYAADLEWPFEDRLITCGLIKRVYYVRKTQKFEAEYRQVPALYGLRNGASENFHYAEKCYAAVVNHMYEMCRAKGADFLLCVLEDPNKHKIPENKNIHCEVIDIQMPGDEQCEARNRVLNNPKFHPNKNVHKYWADRFSEWFDERYGKRLKNI